MLKQHHSVKHEQMFT